MKKRILALLVAAFAVFLFAGCGESAAQSPYVGTWEVYESEYEGYTIPAHDAGVYMDITFNADGTYVENINDYQGEGEWHETEDGVVKTVGGIEYNLTLNDDNQLELEQEGATFFYEKVESNE